MHSFPRAWRILGNRKAQNTEQPPRDQDLLCLASNGTCDIWDLAGRLLMLSCFKAADAAAQALGGSIEESETNPPRPAADHLRIFPRVELQKQ